MTLDTAVAEIKGVGPGVAAKLGVLGLRTVGDLITNYPRKYDDYSQVTPIARLRPGAVTIKATIKQVNGRYARRGMHITEAVASDESGSVRLVWFNQPYRAAGIKHNVDYFISGEFAMRAKRLSITSPSMELVSLLPVNTARILPVYRETKGFTSTQLRKIMHAILPVIETLPETLPAWIINEHKLLSRSEAVRVMHFPPDAAALTEARRRLGFEEVFGLTLAALMNKAEVAQEVSVSVPFDVKLAKRFVGNLPFTLTDAQRVVVWQIYQDMERTMPMNRLVEGDVGSGKTVIAAMAGVMAMQQGFQVAMMAPTELLARQHAETLFALLEPLGLAPEVGLLVGGLSTAQKKQAHADIQAGKMRFIVGTHALFQDAVVMHNLGLVIVDEQHRFGVDQRKALQAKAGYMPHVLHMTATPIPRSLALTLYGELDISVLDVLPSGRKPIITKIASPNSRKQLYETIGHELSAGRQMFVVCPLVSESDALPAKSAEQTFEEVKKVYPQYEVGLLHGKMKPADKDAIMQRFAAGEIKVLVATTVIEVGVNVPNATVMLIENADRFGLAQIHQLRGRVGRSDHQGYCYLMMSDSSEPTRRLRVIEQSTDGFKLADYDLELRGPGAIYGTSQHGQLDLRVAKLSDTALIAEARKTAQKFLDEHENLLDYTELAATVSRLRAITTLN